MAYDLAELHNPSISAPVKFLVRVLNSSKLTSELNIPFSVNFGMNQKYLSTFSSGKEISI